FPGSVLDYTVVADKKITVAEILSAVEKLKVQNIVRTSVIDNFEMDEKKAITLRTEFLDKENTLSPEFLESAQKQILDGLDKAGFPLRA
ncbi:MAG: hypothetical protein FWE23_01215, partial [Chitinivibrionia bacterium]|nr:hypothetical protein [Chitinivibrionia bacterium]